MEENNKVIIFEKKEIILILIFVLILIVTSFTLGIRLGKKISLGKSGIKEEDKKTVELKSIDEEEADKAYLEDSKLTDEEKLKKLMEESKGKLSEELQKFSKEEVSTPNESENNMISSPELASVEQNSENKLEGKYTIQLGSYETLEEAKQFAEGFTVRGYNPIINEVKIADKGEWYRVSLGAFNTMEEAKNYIKKENSLFQGQQHIITEIR